jgi:hypothetical protein
LIYNKTTLKQLDALMGSLNVKGIRERALKQQLEKFYSKIRYAVTIGNLTLGSLYCTKGLTLYLLCEICYLVKNIIISAALSLHCPLAWLDLTFQTPCFRTEWLLFC